MAEEFILVTSLGGEIFSKAQWLDGAMGPMRCESFQFDDVRVLGYGDTAVVVSWYQQVAEAPGKTMERALRHDRRLGLSSRTLAGGDPTRYVARCASALRRSLLKFFDSFADTPLLCFRCQYWELVKLESEANVSATEQRQPRVAKGSVGLVTLPSRHKQHTYLR